MWIPRLLVATLASIAAAPALAQDRVRVLFLGDRGHHRPAERMHQVQVEMATRGIDLFYTDRVADLTAPRLRHYDCVVLYANHLVLPAANERALLDFVAAGKGFVPVHCASACFPRSPRFVALVGGQFQRHGTGVFAVETVVPEHPAVRGAAALESWDETYVHTRFADDATVLQFRVEGDGRKEPWTWVREEGKGRVFYTAWGHDQRTWSKAGFHDVLERGIRWASGDRFVDRKPPPPPFAFEPAAVPHYRPGVAHRDITNLPSMQMPLAPDASQARLRVPAEFRIERFAAEPQIRKPIAMTWDERGRLWLAETTDYPNDIQREGAGHDRITICTDTDGDGAADEFKVFADKLSIPTSLVCARGGVIVAQAPHFLFLQDTDGDDRADVRQVLITGWSTSDSHAGPSNLRYGFDNRIWGSVGYAGFRGTVGGERHRFRQGFFRFAADGSSLEFLTSTTNNTWGLGFSEEGFVFGSTANGNPSVYMAVPNRYYEKIAGFAAPALATIAESTRFHPITDKVRQVDFHGKFTAAAGHALYTARDFPERYWNRAAFVNAPTGHLLHQFFLERQGTQFVARDGFNLLASDDEWTAPIAAEVGPDGAVWVIDWYNYIVQHNPTPRGFENGRGNAYVTPLRDKRHGRIYRVVHRDRRTPAPDLRDADAAKLVAALGHPNLFWRLTAQRLLVERRPDGAVPALLARLADRSADTLGLNPGVQHALWTLAGIDALARIDPAVQEALVAHPAPAVRRVAVALLPFAAVGLAPVADADAQVRLAALLRLADQPAAAVPGAGAVVFKALQDPANDRDRWLPDAATAAAANHAYGFLRAALAEFELAPAAGAPAPAVNLVANPDFEAQADGQPRVWRVRTYSGRAEHALVREGRDGGHCIKITAARGADSSYYVDIDVDPDATYRLTGWIKTAGLRKRGGSNGALFNVHELQGRDTVKTRGLAGDQDWTRVEVTFAAKGRRRVGVNCLFGGWGQSVGTAWFDDVRVVRVPGDRLPGKLGRTISRVMGHYAAAAPADTAGGLLTAMRSAAPGLARALLRGLVRGWPAGRRPELAAAEIAALREWLPRMPAAAALDLLVLLRRWGQADAFRDAAGTLARSLRAATRNGSFDARVLAAEQLVQVGPSLADTAALRHLRSLLDAIEPQTPFELASGLVRAVTSSARPEVGVLVTQRLPRCTGKVQRLAAAALTRRTGWTRALLDAIAAGRVDASVLADAEWLKLSNHPNAAVRKQAAAARTHKPSPQRRAVLERFLAVAERRGDTQVGAALFAKHCAVCHKVGGQGGDVGPGLDGIGARPKDELLIAILDPNQSVDGTYLMWAVETKAGDFLAGRLDAESRTTIEILDVENRRHVIQRGDIATMESSRVSLMPASFEFLGEKGLTDLLEYLASLHGAKAKGGR